MSTKTWVGWLGIASTLLTLQLSEGRAGAEELPEGWIRPARLTQFLKQKRPCYLWVGVAMDVPQLGITNGATPDVLCIWDGVSGSGTVNQRQGCMLGYYHTESAAYGPIQVNQREPVSAPGKACSVSVALALMENYPWFARADSNTAKLLLILAQYPQPGLLYYFGGTGPASSFRAALRRKVCGQIGSVRAAALGCTASTQ